VLNVVGQKLALRVSRQVDKTSAGIRKIVQSYNASPAPNATGMLTVLPTRITEREVYDLKAALYAIMDPKPTDKVIGFE